jgi:hypothetical protein
VLMDVKVLFSPGW